MLHLDFETFSELNVMEVGPQAYARHKSTEALMMSYTFDDEEVQIWVPDGPWDYKSFPKRVLRHLQQGKPFCAHNVEFEWNILTQVLGIPVEFSQCRDTAVCALVHGFPMSLDGAASAAKLGETKDKEGKRLMRIFSVPRKPSKHNPATRWNPEDKPDEWLAFQEYCIQDTVVERNLWEYFGSKWPLSKQEQWVYEETLRMNERGMPIDRPLAERTLRFINKYNQKRRTQCKAITGCNPTQRDQLLEWLQNHGLKVDNLQRVTLERALKEQKLRSIVRDIVSIRLEQGRVSTKKLIAMLKCDAGDGVVRGSYVFNGAGTGRFTAKRVQPHNFQRPTIKDVEKVIELMEQGKWRKIVTEYDDVLEAIGSCMRGFFKAKDEDCMVVSDYNAIEARVLAWLAHEDKLVEMFHEGKDVYCDMAGEIFGKSASEIRKLYEQDDMEATDQRKLGKDTVLGCGYSMWVNTFLNQMESKGSDKIAGIPLRDDPKMRGQSGKKTFNSEAWGLGCDSVYGYRNRYKRIADIWGKLENAIKHVIKKPGVKIRVSYVTVYMKDHYLVIKLPSKRKLYYPFIEIVEEPDKWKENVIKERIRFRSVSEKGIWRWEYTYGAKFIENIVQAIARDLMVYGMYNASKAGFRMIGTVHDELITLYKRIRKSAWGRTAKKFDELICTLPWWAVGKTLAKTIPLKAEGSISIRYHK